MNEIETFLDSIMVANQLSDSTYELKQYDIRYDYIQKIEEYSRNMFRIYFKHGLVLIGLFKKTVNRSNKLNRIVETLLKEGYYAYPLNELDARARNTATYSFEMTFTNLEEFKAIWSIIEIIQEVFDSEVNQDEYFKN